MIVTLNRRVRMYEDRAFPVSCYGAWRVISEATERGNSAAQYFRHKAAALGQWIDPQFSGRGAPLDRTFRVGIPPSVYYSLCLLANDLGVPYDTVGELVACWDGPEEAL